MGDPFRILADTADGLVKFVGYPQVIEALGVSRSTILRAINDGELPPPRKIKNRSVWLASEINNWAKALFEGRLATLHKAATTNTDELSPDQLEEQAVDLVVKAMEQRTGQQVEAADLGMHVIRRITEDEFHAAEKRQFETYSQRFEHFDMMRASIMAAWLFQCLRSIIQRSVPHEQRAMYRDEDTIALFGIAAVHDESWKEAEAYYRRAHGLGKVN
jgi:predicted DNA-binding transcriptional regulator AlpA